MAERVHVNLSDWFTHHTIYSKFFYIKVFIENKLESGRVSFFSKQQFFFRFSIGRGTMLNLI